ncbi:NTP/NDP exchange transporter [Candidatus Similichlamydia laticola]|uniref:ADP,ATP carrier protein n=1 Tax=Candidatus Similichlamydia laticola TaxID=2170265 RepID=A0A369KE23_9BACT|nr:NTP/NDP exchange transporter [Candidatus Similichlamydia laticola]RDB31852.1 ADP/ATP Translocase, NTT1 [Candidatus Similichlamydia laticola]
MSGNEGGFSGWRAYLWPIHAFELKKLLPMFLMFFFISFNYTILRDTKDTLIVTAPGSGAEAIPFIKFWCVLPSAVLFMLAYAKLSNVLSRQALFYVSMTPFLVFFALFATLLYPYRDFFHPTTSADYLAGLLPQGLTGLVAIYRNWTYALFYVLSELWGSVGISLLFWGFANETTRVTEAKRFYTVFGLGANLALLFSGPTIVHFSNFRKNLPVGSSVDAWGLTLKWLMGAVVVCGIASLATYWFIDKFVLTDPKFAPEEKKEKKKCKLSFSESISALLRSKYIGCLSVLVISYGILINIYEVTWKNQIKAQYPDPSDYSAFMGHFSTAVGIASIFMMVFVGGNVIRKFGWKVAALFTPVVLVVTGSAFFFFVIFREGLAPMIVQFGTTPTFLAVVLGALQNIMSKSTKYSLFDPTKEMAYIPLDQETKVKGKAAIDVVAARFGKSGGSLIQQVLLLLFGTLSAITVPLCMISLAIGAVWIYAVDVLNTEFTKLQQKKK